MRISQVIALCVLSGVVSGLLVAVVGPDVGRRSAHYRSPEPPDATIKSLEPRLDLEELDHSLKVLLEAIERDRAGEGFTPPRPAAPPGGSVDPAQRRELDAESEAVRERALARIDERIETQQRAAAQALEDASRRQTSEDMGRWVDEWLEERDLKRERELISRSRDLAYLRRMAGGD